MKVTNKEIIEIMIETWNEFQRAGVVAHEKQREFRKKFHAWDGEPDIAEKVVYTMCEWGVDLNPPKTETELIVERIESVFVRCGNNMNVIKNELLNLQSEIIEMINREELDSYSSFVVGKAYGSMCEMYAFSKDHAE